MSLLLHRRAIARAVAGTLPARREQRLLSHLRTCEPCRAHYDRLTTVAAALGAGAIGARRERARLEAALVGGVPASASTRPAAAGRGARRRFAAAAVLLAPAAAALFLWVRRPPRPTAPDGDGVTWRGGEAGAAPAASPSLLVYASRKGGAGGHGPVRLVADLPASGEGRVALSDYVQFSVRGLRSPSYVTVLGVDVSGGIHWYAPRLGAPASRLGPAARPVAVGPSIDLERAHSPGTLRLYALVSSEPIETELVQKAVRRSADRALPGAPPLGLGVPEISGLLTISP